MKLHEGPAVALLLLLLSAFLFSCEDSVRSVPESRPRDLTELRWTLDTLRDGTTPVLLTALDGQRRDALFAVGATRDSAGVIFQFDGSRWTLALRFDTPSGFADITTAGISELWTVGFSGDSGLIFRNRGGSWSAVEHPPAPRLLTIDASSEFDVWCGGEGGEVLHTTLFQWQTYRLDSDVTIVSLAEIDPSHVYAIGRRRGNSSPFAYPFLLYSFNGVVWTKIDSLPPGITGLKPRFGPRLYARLSRLYALGEGLYYDDLSGWQQQIVSDTLTGMYLQGANNILAVGKGIFHFNGVQWYPFTLPNAVAARWTDAWMDPSNVMILGTIGGNAIVAHGQ